MNCSFLSKTVRFFYQRLFLLLALWLYPFNTILGWRVADYIFGETTGESEDKLEDNGSPPSPPGPSNPPPGKRSTSSKECFSQLLLPYSLADWLNIIRIGSSFDQISKYSCKNDESFIDFNAFNKENVCLQAYVFQARYNDLIERIKSFRRIYLALSTAGIDANYGAMLTDKVKLGGGLGYFYSKLTWKSSKKQIDSINGFYFGPYIEYLFGKGSIGFMMYGVGNFHHSDYAGKDKKIDFSSYDIAMRLEADYALELPADFFIKNVYIYPRLRLDYASVFISNHEKISDVKIDGKHSAFLQSKLSVLFSKTLLVHKDSCFLSNLDIGWVGMMPLCKSSGVIDNPGKTEKKNLKLGSKNQCALSLALVRLQKEGPTMSLGYEAWVGANVSTQVGRFKIEWSW